MRILVVLCLCFTRALSTGAKVGACNAQPMTTHVKSSACTGLTLLLASAAWPSSEPQLLRAVVHAVRNKQKIKVVSRHAHSATRFFCVEGDGLVISTQNYDSVIEVNQDAMTITVQAGAIMIDVIEAAAKQIHQRSFCGRRYFHWSPWEQFCRERQRSLEYCEVR